MAIENGNMSKFRLLMLNVRPTFSVFNRVNATFGNFVSFCQLFLRNTVLQMFADFYNVFFRQLAARVFFAFTNGFRSQGVMVVFAGFIQSIIHSVFYIILPAQIFKIPGTVITLHAVDVIHFKIFRTRADKNFGNKLMNILAGLFAAFHTQSNPLIPGFVQVAFQKFFSWSKAKSVRESFNSTQIRNFIQTIESFNRFPNFRIQFFSGKILFSHSVIANSYNVLIRACANVKASARSVFILPQINIFEVAG